MQLLNSVTISFYKNTICFLISALLLSSCSPVKSIFYWAKKNPSEKPFLYQTPIDLQGGNFDADERNAVKLRLASQLEDSAKVTVIDKAFVFHVIPTPPVYDSAATARSVSNMKGSMLHIGYYNAKAIVAVDTIKHTALKFGKWFIFKPQKQQRVITKYTVIAGNPTLIDTFSYKLKIQDLQWLALQNKEQSLLKKERPVIKADVLGEISRLVDIYRNNGYYKFTTDDLTMIGDSTIEALTNISDDPFESIRKLAEANEKRNKPTVKLALIINPAADTIRLRKFYINNIYIYPDYQATDATATGRYDTAFFDGCTIRYHKKLFDNKFLTRNVLVKSGDIYRQEDYVKTVNSFSRIGAWQSVIIQIIERKDSLGKIDMFIQLVPSKKFGFEANIEASYSVNSNTNNITVANAGNLLGFSVNSSLQNRNLGKQGIKMTHAIRAGVELNLNAKGGTDQIINSNEFSYNNTVSIPKPVWPFRYTDKKGLAKNQSFISSSIANTNRISLFKLNSVGLAFGYEFNLNKPNKNRLLTFKPLNVEFSSLYDRSEAFQKTLDSNPYLRYSFNTALVMGSSARLVKTSTNKRHSNITRATVFNLEQSGFLGVPLDWFGFLQKDLRQFIKLDAERTVTYNYQKSSIVYRLFGGVGYPIGKGDSSLPFFKQYFAGGANSMRAWPVRGIGPGSKPLAAYNNRTLSDRTGDMRLEANIEYRHNLFQIIPNTLTLKWAVFADAGNVWNLKKSTPVGIQDSLQFNIKNLYKQMGLTLGTGLRFDFNYVLLRVDLGFRFKRPELSANSGWKAPSIGFDDALKKLFTRGNNDEYRIWRYENFNFTIGLSYPF
jgi:outer membrane protein insertion porin family